MLGRISGRSSRDGTRSSGVNVSSLLSELFLRDVVHSEALQDLVDIRQRDVAGISQSLDLGSSGLGLLSGETQVELFDAGLNSVPSSDSASKLDRSFNTEIIGVQDLVALGVLKNGLNVNTRFVREGRAARNVVIERDLDTDEACNVVLDLGDHLEIVAVLDLFAVQRVHARQESSERSNSVTFTNTENAGVNVGNSGFDGVQTIKNKIPLVSAFASDIRVLSMHGIW